MRDSKSTEKNLPQISDAEWKVMKVVWERSPVTTNDVVAALAEKTDWKPKTIHTLLRRLVQKNALNWIKEGREYQYTPLVQEQDCIRAASQSFLNRFFNGEVAPLVACFLEQEKLNPAEIEELKKLLEDRS